MERMKRTKRWLAVFLSLGLAMALVPFVSPASVAFADEGEDEVRLYFKVPTGTTYEDWAFHAEDWDEQPVTLTGGTSTAFDIYECEDCEATPTPLLKDDTLGDGWGYVIVSADCIGDIYYVNWCNIDTGWFGWNGITPAIALYGITEAYCDFTEDSWNWYYDSEFETLIEVLFWTSDGIRADDYAPGAKDAVAKTLTIASEAEFGLLAYELNNGLWWDEDEETFAGFDYTGWTILLAKDLDLSAYFWHPANLGDVRWLYDETEEEYYPVAYNHSITFDGQGHTISGMMVYTFSWYYHIVNGSWYDEEDEETYYYSYVNEFTAAGLFGGIDRGIVRNLTLENPVVNVGDGGISSYYGNYSDTMYLGTIAGIIHGAQIRDVVIEEPFVTTNAVDDTSFLGGVVGYAMPSNEDDEPNSVGLYMSIINGVDVFGGEVSSTGIYYNSYYEYDDGYFDENEDWVEDIYHDGSILYLGGVAGANYDSVIASSGVYGTKIQADIDIEQYYDLWEGYNPEEDGAWEILGLYVGGITGYTSMTDEALMGTCVLNNLVLNPVYYVSPSLDAHFFNCGGLVGLVLNDFVVNNLLIYAGSPSNPFAKLFGDVDNNEDYATEFNYMFETAAAAWNALGGNGALYANLSGLNDVAVNPQGGMLAAALVTNAHTSYGLENSLLRYRVWRTNTSNAPYLAEWNQFLSSAVITVGALVVGEAPPSATVSGTNFSGTISWVGNPTTLAANTTYTATITLVANLGYVLPEALTITVNGVETSFTLDADNPYKIVTLTYDVTTGDALPQTGDGNTILFVGLLLMSMLGIGCLLVSVRQLRRQRI